MENAAETTMEEILASIRKIIATDPKGVKAFPDGQIPKFSEEGTKVPTKKTDQETSPPRNDFSLSKPNQRIEPTFSSFAPSPSSSNTSTSHSPPPTSQTSQRLTAALDQDLAGLFGMPGPSPDCKIGSQDKEPSFEKWSTGYSYSKFSENSSHGFYPSNSGPTPLAMEQYQPAANPAPSVGLAQSETLMAAQSPHPEKEGFQGKEPFLTSSLKQNLGDAGAYHNSMRAVMSELSLSPAVEKTVTPQISPDFVPVNFPEEPVTTKSEGVPEIRSGEPSVESPVSHQELAPVVESQSGDKVKTISFSTNSHVSQRTLEDVVSDLLRPMLQEWVENHLPHLVPQLLKKDNCS